MGPRGGMGARLAAMSVLLSVAAVSCTSPTASPAGSGGQSSVPGPQTLGSASPSAAGRRRVGRIQDRFEGQCARHCDADGHGPVLPVSEPHTYQSNSSRVQLAPVRDNPPLATTAAGCYRYGRLNTHRTAGGSSWWSIASSVALALAFSIWAYAASRCPSNSTRAI